MNISGIYRSLAKEISYKNRTVKSGIKKDEILEPVWVGKESLVGDVQVDRKHHGGAFKAVYSYSSEFYPRWRKQLSLPDLAYGSFGENILTTGLDESSIRIGDIYSFGECILQAVQPRFPCRVLSMAIENDKLMGMFIDRADSGIYWSVIKEGFVKKEDIIELQEQSESDILVSEIFPVLAGNRNPTLLKRLRSAPIIEPSWAEKLDQYLNEV
jgi:MOSC domain-containing protein YiiM